MPIANGFLLRKNFKKEYFFDLKVCFCKNCYLFQLFKQPSPKKMFHKNYAFFSETSEYMKRHFKKTANLITRNFKKQRNFSILELGSNDGIFLKNFKNNNHLGIEPSFNVFKVAKSRGINCINKFFSAKLALKLSKKFDVILSGIQVDTETITLKDLIEKSSSHWIETEWEFPKGRRNFKEKDLECALREFEEETGIMQNKITIVENVLPFEEIFIGSNHKAYKHKYFLAYMNDIEYSLNHFQLSEVSKLEWKNIEQCLESIRPYNLEKKELIKNINKVLQEYRLYS